MAAQFMIVLPSQSIHLPIEDQSISYEMLNERFLESLRDGRVVKSRAAPRSPILHWRGFGAVRSAWLKVGLLCISRTECKHLRVACVVRGIQPQSSIHAWRRGRAAGTWRHGEQSLTFTSRRSSCLGYLPAVDDEPSRVAAPNCSDGCPEERLNKICRETVSFPVEEPVPAVQQTADEMTQPGTGKLIFCAAGIFVCYSYYAILQEKITRGTYIDGGVSEKFSQMFALVFMQCIINCLFAKILLMTVMKQGEDTTKTVYYASSALTYLLAMVCSNMALQFVNYPTQVVGKAGKPIPVMILGVLLGGKSYPLKKYCFVTLIVAGMIMFMYKEKKEVKQIEGENFGYLLIGLSLTMDGIISSIQERMRAEHKTKSGHMMFNMNLWSVLFSGVIILCTGELFSFLKFLQRHPSSLQHITVLSVCGALGQYFIFLTVTEFGPLTCSIATTTRKCFTVLASVVFFGNSLIVRQWLGTVFVFLGLFLDMFYGKTKTVKKQVAK